MKTLKELGVNIIGGQILARVNADPNKGDKVLDYKRKTVLAKSVDEGVLVEENIPCNDYKTLPDEKRLTKKGDIIIKMNAPLCSLCYFSRFPHSHTSKKSFKFRFARFTSTTPLREFTSSIKIF